MNALQAPTNLTLKEGSRKGYIMLLWDRVEKATGYKIHQANESFNNVDTDNYIHLLDYTQYTIPQFYHFLKSKRASVGVWELMKGYDYHFVVTTLVYDKIGLPSTEVSIGKSSTPKNLSLQQKENSLILSWDRSRLNSIYDDYTCYTIRQAEESFYDVMGYNYARLKGHVTHHTMSKEDRVWIDIYNLNINTTYYFIISEHIDNANGESMPSEEVSMYIDFNVSKPG